MVIPDILLKGAIRFAIGQISKQIFIRYIFSSFANDFPEKLYAYSTKKSSKWKELLLDLSYFIPVVGTITLIGTIIIVGAYIAIYEISRRDNEFKSIIKHKKYANEETAEEHLEKLQKAQKKYRVMTDELKLEGLSKKEIKVFMKAAKKDAPDLKEDNSKEINKCMQRVENVQLLEPIKDLLVKPGNAYRYCLDKKIQFIEPSYYEEPTIEGDKKEPNNENLTYTELLEKEKKLAEPVTITIGVTKLGKDLDDKPKTKVHTKTFKLKPESQNKNR